MENPNPTMFVIKIIAIEKDPFLLAKQRKIEKEKLFNDFIELPYLLRDQNLDRVSGRRQLILDIEARDDFPKCAF